MPDLPGNFPKRIPRGFVGEKIGGKRVLGANGFAGPVGADGPIFAPMGLIPPAKTNNSGR